MELKIYNPSEDGFIKSIDWNYDEIKKEVQAKVEHYKNLVYNEDQIKIAKTDRATLNKFITALENKRKEIKKQCLAPYEAFEKQLKEVVAIVNEPVLLIDSQVKNFEEQQKQLKLETICQFWDSIEKPEWLSIKQIFNDKWLNASVKMSAIEGEIIVKLDRIAEDVKTLSSLPEFSFEAVEVYKESLNLNAAISEGQRLLDIQKRKAEFEVETKPAPSVSVDTDTTDDGKQWISFHALLSVEDAMALKEFFIRRNIEFKKI